MLHAINKNATIQQLQPPLVPLQNHHPLHTPRSAPKPLPAEKSGHATAEISRTKVRRQTRRKRDYILLAHTRGDGSEDIVSPPSRGRGWNESKRERENGCFVGHYVNCAPHRGPLKTRRALAVPHASLLLYPSLPVHVAPSCPRRCFRLCRLCCTLSGCLQGGPWIRL